MAHGWTAGLKLVQVIWTQPGVLAVHDDVDLGKLSAAPGTAQNTFGASELIRGFSSRCLPEVGDALVAGLAIHVI